jgi:uncharacterized protein (DUF1800 family)
MAMSIEATIATNRFGLGATPGLIEQVGSNPKAWLKGQLNSPTPALIQNPDLLSISQAFEEFLAYTRERSAQRRRAANPSMPQPQDQIPAAQAAALLNRGRQALAVEIEARINQGLTTPAPFLERWTLFWSNALTVSAKNLQTIYVAGPYEREAIRPHVLGKFSDLLTASALHPGMLIYLDQVRSVGPNAPGATTTRARARNAGLNENLAREILELHTIGADGGYSQADVTEFARALTGWTIGNPRLMGARNGNFTNADVGRAVFVPALHEPGARTIMGQAFPPNGANQAREILTFLAQKPQTARNIARKVATHFVSDTPPPALVTRLEQSFIASGGDLRALALTLIDSPEPWATTSAKFKSPQDFLISTMRAANTKSASRAALRDTLEQLGQAPFRAPSPKGWPDNAQEWGSPDAILKRVDWSNLAADVISETMSPMAFAENALGAALTPATRTAISRAQDNRQGIVLALMSPEFQRR